MTGRITLAAKLTLIADAIERLTGAIGRAAMWCALFMVLAEAVLVLLRYVLGLGSIPLQESISYAHAALFMLAAAWTLQRNGHVRVDLFYSAATPRRRAAVDLAGALVLLMPFVVGILILSLPYVGRSVAILEGSREASGLPFVYLLKMLIPAFAMLMALQGLAQALRALTVLWSGPTPALKQPSGTA